MRGIKGKGGSRASRLEVCKSTFFKGVLLHPAPGWHREELDGSTSTKTTGRTQLAKWVRQAANSGWGA
jgi:hypothetical protein